MIGSRCCDVLNVYATDLFSHFNKVEDILRFSRGKERLEFPESRTLESSRRNVAGHLRTLISQMAGFRTRAAEEIENVFGEFYHMLVRLLLTLASA